MVPPVATAVMKRNKQKSQNQGAKDVATPLINCRNTAATRGIRRPNLWKVKKRTEVVVVLKPCQLSSNYFTEFRLSFSTFSLQT